MTKHFVPSRRAILKSGGALIVSFSLASKIDAALAQGAEIASARLLMKQILEVASVEGPTMDQRMQSHRNFAYIAQLCLRAIERIYTTSGGNANYESNPLQRFWRDIHAMSVHAAIGWDTAGETYGLNAIGQPRNQRDPYV